MTLDDLTVNFSHLDRKKLMEDWRWLLAPTMSPVLITAIGNAFLQDESSGEIFFLDVGSADIILIAVSMSEFNELLEQHSFVMKFFEVSLFIELQKISPRSSATLYSFKKLPTLGGDYQTSNFELADVEVHFSICGQLQRQINNFAPGTPIGKVTVS